MAKVLFNGRWFDELDPDGYHEIVYEASALHYDNRNQMTSAKDEATDGGTILQQLDFKYDVFENRIEKKVTINST